MGFGFSLVTQVQVAISLVGIAAGFVVAYGLVAGRRLPVRSAAFLAFVSVALTVLWRRLSPPALADVRR